EVSRVTSETLLDAANTYVDLLAARTSEAIIRRTQGYQEEVLRYAESLFKADKSTEGQLEAIRAQASGRQQVLAQLRQQGDAAPALRWTGTTGSTWASSCAGTCRTC